MGAFTGLFASIFHYLIHEAQFWVFSDTFGLQSLLQTGSEMDSSDNRPYLFILVPILGGLIVGLIAQFIAPEVKGSGTDAMLDTYHHQKLYTRKRSPFLKALSTFVTLSTGGSAGKEGALLQIGSGFGYLISRMLGLGLRAGRALFLSGISGALGAIFRAPLGAAITSIEILYKKDFETDCFVSCVLASVAGYMVFTSFHGFDRLFDLQTYHFRNYIEIIFYVALAFLCYLFGVLFIILYGRISSFFTNLSMPLFLKPAFGGLFVGLIGFICYEAIGEGFGFLSILMIGSDFHQESPLFQFLGVSSIDNNYLSVIILLFAIIILKTISTIVTVASGSSGGFFGPSIFIGALLGAIVGITVQEFTNIEVSYVSYMVVGMAAFFSGIANAPLGVVIMVTELTGNYELLVPLLFVAVLNLIFTSKVSLYKNQYLDKLHTPMHFWNITQRFLHASKVSSIFSIQKNKLTFDENVSVGSLMRTLFRLGETDYIICRKKERKLKGMFSWHHVHGETRKSLLHKRSMKDHLITDLPTITKDTSLSEVLDIQITYNLDKLPVVDNEDIVLGYIKFKDVLRAYHHKIKNN